MTLQRTLKITAVIPAHNPDPERLRRVLIGLCEQQFPSDAFEVILVDNASDRFPAAEFFQDCSPPNFSIRQEPRLGLTSARLAGFAGANGDVVVLVDDDNVLDRDYFAEVLRISNEFPYIASWSGNVELVFEEGANPPPEIWRPYLTERKCTMAIWSNDPAHNGSTPWGAGLCVRRELAIAYRESCASEPARLKLDLAGKQLTYGGDTDIAFYGCRIGYGKGVFPKLKVRHLIPARRCEEDYLLKAVEGHAYSEWLHHWVLNGVIPSEREDITSEIRRIVRFAFSNREERVTMRAKRDGHERAKRELGNSK
jgi:glycosyltransferase involved in cell wall biosynthesis